jgi:hypothetical protein
MKAIPPIITLVLGYYFGTSQSQRQTTPEQPKQMIQQASPSPIPSVTTPVQPAKAKSGEPSGTPAETPAKK